MSPDWLQKFGSLSVNSAVSVFALLKFDRWPVSKHKARSSSFSFSCKIPSSKKDCSSSVSTRSSAPLSLRVLAFRVAQRTVHGVVPQPRGCTLLWVWQATEFVRE